MTFGRLGIRHAQRGATLGARAHYDGASVCVRGAAARKMGRGVARGPLGDDAGRLELRGLLDLVEALLGVGVALLDELAALVDLALLLVD